METRRSGPEFLASRVWRNFAAISAVLASAASGCSKKNELSSVPNPPLTVDGGMINVVTTHPNLPPIAGAKDCTIQTADVTRPVDFHHEPECTVIHYPTEPPAWGPHYPDWVAYKKYNGAIPEPFVVHNMEHGGVVLFYNCPNGCPDVVKVLSDVFDERSQDPTCFPPVHAKMVLVENPKLDVPLAAAAWGTIYRATCIDKAGLAKWVSDHYDHGSEPICADGLDFTAADGGVQQYCQGDAGLPTFGGMDALNDAGGTRTATDADGNGTETDAETDADGAAEDAFDAGAE